MVCFAANKPVVTKSESPGRIGMRIHDDSKKTMDKMTRANRTGAVLLRINNRLSSTCIK